MNPSEKIGGESESSFEMIRRALRDSLADLSPQLLRAAIFVLENPTKVAFLSVRGLAKAASVNPSTIVRLSKVSGCRSFNDFRAAFRDVIRPPEVHYGERAAALTVTGGSPDTLSIRIARASIGNVEALFQPETTARMPDIARLLVNAPQVFVVGFRSSFALAYYFAYAGRMAFPTIRLVQYGGLPISDELAAMRTGDVLLIATFRPYSTEALRAAELARSIGVSVVCLTDSITAPVTRGAAHVIEIPMSGPQYLPSLVAGTAACEALLAEMVQIAGQPAIEAINTFEERVRLIGGYGA